MKLKIIATFNVGPSRSIYTPPLYTWSYNYK